MVTDMRLDIALIHYPVVNRKKEIIGSAVTNLDLHDIARAGKTFGVDTYWVVTPYAQQRALTASIVGHWTDGYGGTVNPDRAGALSLIQISSDLHEVLAKMTEQDGRRPLVVATSAGRLTKSISYTELQSELHRATPVLLLLGTAWGLAPEVIDLVDATLPPINGPGAFNHLSVRSAASIILDRLLGKRENTA
ncbi:MAG: RNA methyltransferase [Candidatus Electrothrix sp. AR4]|nr:RNA methyltransferase [Candidatus Electrothrix sp. AR4]